jgi:hypothetical protein
VSAEIAREDAEGLRDEAEGLRESAESARVTAESARAVWEAYDAEAQYAVGNKVYYLGSSYICHTIPPVGTLPTDTGYWSIIVQKGDTGPANTLTAGTVTTLSAGESATASVTGTAPHQTLNLGIPQGIQGEKGDTGAAGTIDNTTISTLSGILAGNGTNVGVATAAQAAAQPMTDPANLYDSDTTGGQLQEVKVLANGKADADDVAESFESYALWKTTSPANPVSVYPVPESPMYPKVSGTFTQEGTGDPSPTNIRPITPWLASGGTVKVKRTGKNLFNLNVFTDGYYFSNIGLTPPLSTWRLSNYIPCSPSIAMKLSGIITFPNTSRNNFRFYDKNLVDIGYLSVNSDLPVTPIAGSCFVRFSYKTTEADLIQFEIGSNATPYEPYTESEITLTAPQEIPAGWMDNEGNGQKTWRTLIFNGTEEWNNHSGTYDTATKMMFSRNVGQKAISSKALACSHIAVFEPLANNTTVQKVSVDVVGINFNPTDTYLDNIYIKIEKSTLPSADLMGFKAYLAAQYAAGTPVTVYYQLATPVSITPAIAPLTAAPQLDRVTPRQNVLTASTGNVELTYAKSPIREADELAAVIAALP